MIEAGRLMAFFSKVSAAVVELRQPLRVGETIYVRGHTTELRQVVESIQRGRAPVQEASCGQVVGIRIRKHCRKHDVVYKFVS